MRRLDTKKILILLFIYILWLVAVFFFVPNAHAGPPGPPVTPIISGGTGTSTSPGYGNVLVGGKNGEYERVATSTFGIVPPVTSVFGRTAAVSAQSGDYTTSLITEGTNLYYTLTRWASALAGTTTDALPEGTTNKYFTNARAQSALSGLYELPLTFTYPLQRVVNTISSAFGTSTSNTWGGTQTFTNTPVLGSLTGFVKAASGALSTALINLGSDITGTLGVVNGGTGSTTLSGILKGNGTGVVQTAVAGNDYENPLTFNSPLNRIGNAISFLFNTINTWTGLNTFSGGLTSTGVTTLATTTASVINGTEVVDGTKFAKTSSGIVSAIAAGGNASTTVYLRNGTYNMTNQINLTGKTNIKILCESKDVVLTIQQANLANFGFGYMLSGGSDITIDNCTLDGGYSTFTAPPSNQGGGIAPGTRWIVSNDWIKNFNYFAVWNGTGSTDLKFFGNRFSGPGVGTDNIGGGGFHNSQIYSNIWDADIVGNVYDNTGGDGLYFHHNTIYSANSVYLEAVTNARVESNDLLGGGGIVAQSDSGYSPLHVTNSRWVTVNNNTLRGGAITYTNYSSSTDMLTGMGGNVLISDNTISSSTSYGILIHAASASSTQEGRGFTITNNKIYNANLSAAASQNTGYGISAPSGINVMQGRDVVISNNTVVDDRTPARQNYCIEVGQTVAPSAQNEPQNVTLSGNTCTGYVTGDIFVVSNTYTTNWANIWGQATSTFSNPIGIGKFSALTAMLDIAGVANRGLNVALTGVRANSNHGVYITDTSSAGPNATFNVTDANTNSNWASMYLSSQRSGQAMQIDQSGTGIGLNINHTGGSGTGLKVSTSGTGPSITTSGGSVGIGTTTPGSILSIGNTGPNTINISATATSTFGSGINILTGCFAINGTCLSTGGSSASSTLLGDTNTFSGTDTFSNTIKVGSLSGLVGANGGTLYSVASSSLFGFTPVNPTRQILTTWPIQGGGDLSADRTLTFGGLSTSTAAVVGNIPYFSGTNTFANIGTSTLTPSSPLTGSFTQLGSGGSIGCQTASGSQAGCLSSNDWTIFNAKQALLSFVYPLVNAANSISLAFGTTTANIWSALNTFTGGLTSSGNTTLATTTAFMLNGMIYMDGTHYALTDVGMQQAANDCSGMGIQVCSGVMLHPGTTTISARVTIPAPMTIMANSWNSILAYQNSSAQLYLSGKGQVTFKDFLIDQSLVTTGSVNTTFGIYNENASDMLVSHLRVKDAYSFGIFTNTTAISGLANRITIEDSTLNGRGSADVIGGGPTDSTSTVKYITVKNNRVIQDASLGAHYDGGIDLVRANQYDFSNNNVQGFIVFGSEQSPNTNSIISHNIVSPAIGNVCGRIGINSDTATTSSTNLTFDNNVFNHAYLELENTSLVNGLTSLTGTGNVIDATGCTYGVLMTNVKGANLSGITEANANTGIKLVSSSYNIINGIFHNNSVYGIESSGTSDYNTYNPKLYSNGTDYNVVDTHAGETLKGGFTVTPINSTASIWASPTTTQVAFGATAVPGDATMYVERSSGEGVAPVAGGTVARFQNNFATGYAGALSFIAGTTGSFNLNFGDYTNDARGTISYNNSLGKFNVTGGNFGIATSSPGSLLSINNIANFTAATSTFYSTGGINLTGGGCFAINGTCLSTSGTLAFSYPFPNNATTTTLTFSNGFVASASSTINASTTVTGALTLGSTLFGAGLGSCNGASSALTWSAGTFGCNTIASSASTDFTYLSNFNAINAATTSSIWAKGGLNSSSTIQSTGFNVDIFGAYQQGGSNLLLGSSTSGLTLGGLGAGAALTPTTTAATGNTAFGYQALNIATSSRGLTAFGYQALSKAIDYATQRDTAVGYQAFRDLTVATQGTAVGSTALLQDTTGGSNTAVGYGALQALTTASQNTAIGATAGKVVTGSNNTLLGFSTGSKLTTGGNNIIIGQQIEAPSNTSSDQLDIQSIIFGTNNTQTGTTYGVGQIGIGSTSPSARFAIHANNGDTNTTLFAIGSSTASATTTLLTVLNTGNVGLSTTSPSEVLSVQGNGLFSGNISTANITATGTASIIKTLTLGQPADYDTGNIQFSQNGTVNGRIAVPSNSDFWLHNNNSDPSMNLTLSRAYDNDQGISIKYTPGTVGAGAGVLAIGQLLKNSGTYTHGITELFTNGVERLRINSSGSVGIGTTSPAALLSVDVASSTAGTSVSAGIGSIIAMTISAVKYTIQTVDLWGHLVTSGPVPTIGTCGSSPTVLGNDRNLYATVGTGVVSACTVTFAHPYANAPICITTFNMSTATTTVIVASSTASTLLITGSASTMGGSHISVHCEAFNPNNN